MHDMRLLMPRERQAPSAGSLLSQLVCLRPTGAPHDHSLCPKARYPGADGKVNHFATPMLPQRSGRMINVGGEHEADYLGFRDYTTEPVHVGPKDRPLNERTSRSMRQRHLRKGCPITRNGEAELRRIAQPRCRLGLHEPGFHGAHGNYRGSIGHANRALRYRRTHFLCGRVSPRHDRNDAWERVL